MAVIHKWLVYAPTGQFVTGGPKEPRRPILHVVDNTTVYDPDYVVVETPEPNELQPGPDPRTQRWNGSAVVDKSAEVIAALENSEQFAVLRADRNALLTASDWMQLPNSPLSAAQVSAWATYRQALRDLPATTDDPAQVVWPTPTS
jgi:hypothetical protein